jgi:LAGLIDADG endonuclease
VPPATDTLAAFFGGFVAGEGSFTRAGDPPAFRFSIGLGAVDTDICQELRSFFGCGRIHVSRRRKSHYDDEVQFVISAMVEHLEVTIPFMDAHLPESYKRQQYLRWRGELMEYWETRARRRRACSVEGCDAPSRARGVCRHHLWVLHGC